MSKKSIFLDHPVTSPLSNQLTQVRIPPNRFFRRFFFLLSPQQTHLSWYQTVRGEGPLLDGRGHLLQSLAGSLLQRTVGVALARIKHDGLLVAVFFCLFVG